MSKLNISFNNTNYAIDESSLVSATTNLQSHLSTVMNGTGATINLGGVDYSVDSTKLSTATNDFISYLGTIAGDGAKVVVNGVEYSVDSTKLSDAISSLQTAFDNLGNAEERLEGDGSEFYTLAPTALSFRSTAPLNELQEIQINGVTVDPSNYTLEEGSTIVTFPIEYLKTLDVGSYEVTVASDSKTVKGDFTVAAPELNEHGFYYNQPYTAYVAALGGRVSCIFVEGLLRLFFEDGSSTMGTYTISEGNMELTTSVFGNLHMTISADKTELYNIETGSTFTLCELTVIDKECYIYLYSEQLCGYTVRPYAINGFTRGAIKTGIYGHPTVALGVDAFKGESLVVLPTIPSTVTSIGNMAFSDCTSLLSITIPSSVTSIGDMAFASCHSLSSIAIPNSVTSIGEGAVQACTNLDTIIFEGTMEQWNAITKGNDWNQSIPATYVQCSDGQVAL